MNIPQINDVDNIKIFHAGTRISNGAVRVTGGRILSVNAFSDIKQDAIDLAYEYISKIRAYNDADLKSENPDLVFYRKDIGS